MAFLIKPSADMDAVSVLEQRFPTILRRSKNEFTSTHRNGIALLNEIATNKFHREWAEHCKPRQPLICRNLEEAVFKVSSALQTVFEKQKEGCWYPPMQNGERMKVPVAHFLIAPVTKGAGVFSPFLHFYFRRSAQAKIIEAKTILKPRICNIVESIMRKANVKAPDYFWQGALNLLNYWQGMPDAFLNTDAGKLLAGKASSLFLAVEAYQASGGWVPDGFVCPQSPVWGRFRYWVERNNGVALP